MFFYPFPKQVLDCMCLQYKSFENTVGKGEIAHNKQFFLFHLVFYPFCELCASYFSLEVSEICCLGKGYYKK